MEGLETIFEELMVKLKYIICSVVCYNECKPLEENEGNVSSLLSQVLMIIEGTQHTSKTE